MAFKWPSESFSIAFGYLFRPLPLHSLGLERQHLPARRERHGGRPALRSRLVGRGVPGLHGRLPGAVEGPGAGVAGAEAGRSAHGPRR